MADIPDFLPPPAELLSQSDPRPSDAPGKTSREPQLDSYRKAPASVVPIFPLSDVWLFPGAVLPLNVFEPRYRQMIEDSLDGPGRLVIGTVERGHEQEMCEAPPFYPVAGLGEIARHERREDGRFVILLVGLQRVQLEEVDSDRLYRRVRATPVTETEPEPARREELREALITAIADRAVGQKVPDDLPLTHLIDVLMLRMPLPHCVQNELYTELDLERKAVRALEEHANRSQR